MTDANQIIPERFYSYTASNGRLYRVVFSKKYLGELKKVSETSPEYFIKVLQKLSYGVHGSSRREPGVIILRSNRNVFEVRTMGGGINGFRSMGYIRGNVLYFLRLSKEGGHGPGNITREQRTMRDRMFYGGYSSLSL